MIPQQGFNLGRSAEITREEMKFAKFVDRLRKKFNLLFDDLLKTQLILKGIITDKDWDSLKQDIQYLYAQDQSINDFRSYRLDRISGEVKRSTKTFAKIEIELPKVHFPAVSAILEIRRDSALDLLSRAEVLTTGEEWIRARIEFKSQNHAVAEILRNSPNVKILEPISLVSSVTKELDRLAAIHGK